VAARSRRCGSGLKISALTVGGQGVEAADAARLQGALATLEAEMLPMIEVCLGSPEAAAAAQAWRDRRAACPRQREDKEKR
jgi:hypothetical protein